MWKSKRRNQQSDQTSSHSPSKPTSSPKHKFKDLFHFRSRSLSQIPDTTESSSRTIDSHPESPSSLPEDYTVIDFSSTTGISEDVESSALQTPPPLIPIADSESGPSTRSISTENTYSAILYGDTSRPKSLGTRVINSTAYQGIKTVIETIRSAPAPVPHLKEVTWGLLQVINVFETFSQNQEDRDTMIHKLEAIVHLLQQKSNSAPSSSFIGRVERLKQTLNKHIELTKEHMQHAKFRRVIEGKKDSNEIAAFQTALLHAFEVFVIDTTLETELGVDEILMDRLFEKLPRVKTAAYNSASKVKRNGCTDGTREQILKNLVSWATDASDKKIYWLNGMAGTGKTTIAYSFCTKLEELGLLGASFFCSRSEDNSSDTRQIFPTIAYYLARHLPDASSAKLLASIREDPDVGSKRLDLQFSKLIVDPMMVIPPEHKLSFIKIVVLDALDECKNQNEVGTILSLLSLHATNLPIKFFITSRPKQEIEDEFRYPTLTRSKFNLHDVEKDIVGADIRLYVKERFSTIAMRKLVQDMDKWPTEEEITVVVERAGVLFIYAATVCSYVGNAYREGVKSRLQLVISSSSGDMSHKAYGVLDDLYRDILDAAYEGKDSEEAEDIKSVLHIVIGSQHPLSAWTIGELLKVDTIRVLTALSQLHSVIAVPEESDDEIPIAPLHASFLDFLKNHKRAGKHYLEPNKTQEIIAKLCLRMMQDVLVKDGIGGSNDEDTINELHDTRAHISEGLEYVCTYWASHVTELVTPDVLLNSELMEFYNTRVLRWIECMSIMGRLDIAVKSLQKLEVMTQTNAELLFASMDGRRFILQNLEVLQSFPLETYSSALVWLPKKSRIRRVFTGVKMWEVVCGLNETWDACESVLKGHTDTVESVAMSHDGRSVVSGSLDRTIRVWDVETGEEEKKFEGHSHQVLSVAFSHDRKWVVSGSADRTIRIWNVQTGEEERKFEGHAYWVNSVAFSHDGKRVVSGSDDTTIRVWNMDTGEEEMKFEGHAHQVLSVAFSHDGKKVVSGSYDTIRIWNVETGEEETIFEGHADQVMSAAFSHDGKRVVSGSHDGTTIIWNVETGEEERKFKDHSESVDSMAFSHDGRRVVSASKDGIRIWNIETGQEERKFEGHSKVTSMAFSHDGKRVVSGSFDRTIRIWNMDTGEDERKFEVYSDQVTCIAFSHDGKRVVSGSGDRTIRIWNAETGEEERKFEYHSGLAVACVAFSPAGKTVVSGSYDGTTSIWNVETGGEERKFECLSGTVASVAISHDEKRVVSGFYDGTTRIWNIHTGEEERKFEGYTSWVTSVEFLHDGKRVVSESYDETIGVWNTETGEEERKIKIQGFVKSAAFSHDGKRVSGSVGGTIRIWNVETGEEERKFEGHSNFVGSVEFSHDGKRMVSGSNDRTIRIWNVDTGLEERKFEGHSYWVNSVALSHDGKRVVSGSGDRTIRIWNMDTGDEEGKFEIPSKCVRSAAFSDDGKRVVSISSDRTIRVWNVETGVEEKKFKDDSTSVKFSHNGKRVVSGSYEGTIRIWNVETGEEERKFEGHSGSVNFVTFSHDERRVVSGSDYNTLRIWNVETGEEERRIEDHSNIMKFIASSHDGERVISSSRDRTIRILNVETGEEETEIESHSEEVTSKAFSYNGR